MTWLLLGLVLFFGIHSVSILNEPWRDRMSERLGEWPWKGVYTLVASLGLAAMIFGYGLARQEPVLLYTPPAALRGPALLLLLPVFPLFVATYFPGRIKSAVRHPTLVATLLWSGAHLLVRGRLADVLLFGGFGLWAAADLASMRSRRPRALPGAPASPANDVIVLVVGIGLYVAFLLWLHRWIAGVSPLA